MDNKDRATHTGRALSQDKELRCERCGDTFDQHCVVTHPCVGFANYFPEMDVEVKEGPEYEEFGDYVRVGDMSIQQAKEMIQEQIDCWVPETRQSFVTIKMHEIPYVGVAYITWTFRKAVE